MSNLVDSLWTQAGMRVDRMFNKTTDRRRQNIYNKSLHQSSTIRITVFNMNYSLKIRLYTLSTGPIKITN